MLVCNTYQVRRIAAFADARVAAGAAHGAAAILVSCKDKVSVTNERDIAKGIREKEGV